MKTNYIVLVAIMCLMAVLLLLTGGCATHTRTYKETTETHPQEVTTEEKETDGTTTTETSSSQPAQQSTTVVKEEKTESSGGRGVVGGTFHLIGQILAFPFKLIAGVFEMIF